MRIDVNLATRPFVNRMPHAILLIGLGTGAAVLTAWNLTLFLSARAEARAAETQLADIERDEKALERRGDALRARLAKENLPALTLRVEAADEVLAQRALSWSLLLDRLEEVLPWDAALWSVSTAVGKDDISMNLDLRARNQEYYLQFIDALEASPCFSDVYPSGDVRTQSGEFEVGLSLTHDPDCGLGPEKDTRKGVRSRKSRRGGGGGRG